MACNYIGVPGRGGRGGSEFGGEKEGKTNGIGNGNYICKIAGFRRPNDAIILARSRHPQTIPRPPSFEARFFASDRGLLMRAKFVNAFGPNYQNVGHSMFRFRGRPRLPRRYNQYSRES